MQKIEMSGKGKTVCVTGASGYIASWIVKLLLQRGYTVNATVRSLNDPAKTEHLLALDGAKERLHLFEANLLEDGSFDSAFQGCDGVFHTASPVIIDSPNPQADVIDPAVKGTLNVLASCLKAPVKRVIVTSSTAAVVNNGRPLTDQTVIDETWFSTPEGCEEVIGKWYLLSKTLAEDAAWKFAKENNIDLVVMNPAVVVGPSLQTTLNFSATFILSLINGSEAFLNTTFGWVHVKDVAEAHIRAYELPSAKGRYLLSERVLQTSDVVKTIHELYPNDFKHLIKCVGNKPVEPTFKFNLDKARSLGIDSFVPFEISLKEAIEWLKEKKFLS